jgi:hypothetical protein
MPIRSKRSRAAKRARQNASAVFAAPAPRTPSPQGSEYVPSDDSVIDVKSGDKSNNQAVNAFKASVEALQRLYSADLPPALRLKEEEPREPQKPKKRKAVYTGESETTKWRRRTAQRHAAEGCQKLDAFFVKRVCLLSVEQ